MGYNNFSYVVNHTLCGMYALIIASYIIYQKVMNNELTVQESLTNPYSSYHTCIYAVSMHGACCAIIHLQIRYLQAGNAFIMVL